MAVILRLFYRFKQFGALKLVIAYVRMGLFGEFVKQGLNVLLCGMSINEAYSRIQGKVVPLLKRKYRPLLKDLVQKYSEIELAHKKSKRVWICWLQGMNNAPEIVKICHASIRRYMPEMEITIITNENINQYVVFPSFIQQKYKDGKIPIAQYSDLLRLELLIRYGGTWIDSTVLCSDLKENNLNDYLDVDLFFFQFLREGETRFLGMSNWFITASTNQKTLLILREMLYQYWRDYNCLVAYFIFHIFFLMIAEELPEEIETIPRKSNRYCFLLEHRLGDMYQEDWMRELTGRCCFHKLSQRLWNEAEGKENTFLERIKEEYRN